MDHRRFLARPDAHHPFAGGDVLARVGGRAAVEALIDGLYNRIETDAADAHFTRTPLKLDAKAWTDLARITKNWLRETAAIEKAAAKRLAHNPDAAIDVGLVILLFEALPFSAQTRPGKNGRRLEEAPHLRGRTRAQARQSER